MAMVLVEEVLMGLDEVKLSLDQAVTLLEGLTEDIRPELGDHLKASLEATLLEPLQSRVMALETLMEELAVAI